MKNFFRDMVFIGIPLFFVVFSLFMVPYKLIQLYDFNNNYIPVECVVIDYKESFNSTSDYDDYYGSKSYYYTYSAIYLYTDEDGKEYELKSKVYTSRKPVKGDKKEVYINPENPTYYYNEVSDILSNIIVFPIMFVFGLGTLILTLKTKKH